MNNSLGSLLDSSKSLLILLPTNPTMDQAAAGLSLFVSLEKEGTVISCPTPMLVEFNRLVGVNKVTTELGSKNLSITLADYPADNVEKVSYDIINGQFKLSVVPKPQFEAPKKDQVILSYTGVSADTILMIGGANENHFPLLTSPDIANAKLAHIGIRQVNFTKEVMAFDSSAATISELIARFITETGKQMNSDIATNLLLGIDEGTKSFSSQTTTADTFSTVADLMKAGGKRQVSTNQPVAADFPIGAIPGQLPPRGNFPPQAPQPGRVPKSWLEPKIFKGTNVS